MDDYFFLPPISNHAARLENNSHIGKQEVDLIKLQTNIHSFLINEEQITKPLVYYKENTIGSESIQFENNQILIIEGTYVFSLDNINYRVFMDRNYLETKLHRDARARDEQSDFVESVLAIEHEIIISSRDTANCIIHKNFSVSTLNQL
jgi:uridine kinase